MQAAEKRKTGLGGLQRLFDKSFPEGQMLNAS